MSTPNPRKVERWREQIISLYWWCMTDDQLAELLDISPRRVLAMRQRMGLHKYHRWTGRDLKIIRENMRFPTSVIADMIGASASTTRKIKRQLQNAA